MFWIRLLQTVTGLGFVLSVICHLWAIFGMEPSRGLVFGLGVVAFSFLFAFMLRFFYEHARHLPPHRLGSFNGCPPWLASAIAVAFAYAVFNHGFYGQPGESEAGLQLFGPKKEVESLRGVCSFLMAMYLAGFGLLYSACRRALLWQVKSE